VGGPQRVLGAVAGLLLLLLRLLRVGGGLNDDLGWLLASGVPRAAGRGVLSECRLIELQSRSYFSQTGAS